MPIICAPEDFQLEPGAVSDVCPSQQSPLDVFRCSGCTRAECQGGAGCADMQWRWDSDGYLKKILTASVYDVAVNSNLEAAERLSEQLDNTILLKREDMQPVFSFKCRGAFNKMKNLSEEQRQKGVICSSAGNHAQGVALAASRLGCEALVCMPETTPEIKVKAVKRLGGTVELVGESYTETQAYAQERARQEGKVFVAPYDDPFTIAGQGTVGQEIMAQLTSSSQSNLHAIFVPVGGGGLIAGVAAYVKALRPDVRIIGVEPSGANCMAASLAKGERVTLSSVDAFADGVAVKTIGAETFRLCQQLVDGIVLVDNAAVSGAVQDVFEETRCILEPAGALAVAGARAYLKHHCLKGQTVVAITSGANINFHRLRLVSELADVGASKEAILAVTLSEAQGQFRELIDATVADTTMQITELKYRYSAGPKAHVLMSVAIKTPAELSALMSRLSTGGFSPLDLSAIQEAQVHLRHLVGGRARSFMGELPDERIMTVEFPERPGALRAFLLKTSPRWNISLFHYRKSGIQTSQVLLGIQVPAQDEPEFQKALELLPEGFTIGALKPEAQQAFSMFIT
ncbi:hypothetical protein WJX74_002632 [Apatococcus lobatus]|uniref:Threonine dehydratase n=1 Tax=Apatococcus lobatus TaxID=904363 RepID=A0AAW1SDV3_9CHLO